MATQVSSWLSEFGIGKETTYATGVVPSVFWSTRAKWTDIYEELVDEGNRGNAAADQLLYQGIRESTLEVPTAEFYPDDWGHVLMSIMGQDTVTGTNPYTHTIGYASGLPPSYSATDYSGATSGGQSRRMVGLYNKKLEVKWVDNGKFTTTSMWFGRASTPVAKPAKSFSALQPFVPWQGALTLNGGSNNKMRELTLSVERLEPVNIFGSAGTQDPAYGFVGRVRVVATAIFAITDETEFLYYVNNTQPVFSLLLTQSASVALTIQMTKSAFTKGTVLERGKEFLIVSSAVKAIANTADISTGGSSSGSLLFLLKNANSAAY